MDISKIGKILRVLSN